MLRHFFAAIIVGYFATTAVAQPNIIVFVADDMATEDCGAYGHPNAKTPNIDRMAKEGMVFKNAYLTCSSCSPSRSSIMTGRYPHQTGAEQLHWPLPGDQVMFPKVLREAGYWTASVGKWHLGNQVMPQFDLVKQGGGKSGCEHWVPVLKDRPKDKPFFMWLASIDPHRPYEDDIIPNPTKPDEVVIPPYLPDTPKVRKDMMMYQDEIRRLDGFVGEVMAELERQGVLDETLLIFMSDNGRPFPRCKTTVYDSGIRTPFVARWPSRIKAGTVTDRLVSAVDLSNTLIAVAGGKAPDSFLGHDFSPLFADPNKVIREYIFGERNWHDHEGRSRAVRDERYKLIRNDYPDLPHTPPADAIRSLTFEEMKRLRDEKKLTQAQFAVFQAPIPRYELYDCEADPHELKNLANDPEQKATFDRLNKALETWGHETKDFVPAFRTPDDYSRETGTLLRPRQVPRIAADREYTDKIKTP